MGNCSRQARFKMVFGLFEYEYERDTMGKSSAKTNTSKLHDA